MRSELSTPGWGGAQLGKPQGPGYVQRCGWCQEVKPGREAAPGLPLTTPLGFARLSTREETEPQKPTPNCKPKAACCLLRVRAGIQTPTSRHWVQEPSTPHLAPHKCALLLARYATSGPSLPAATPLPARAGQGPPLTQQWPILLQGPAGLQDPRTRNIAAEAAAASACRCCLWISSEHPTPCGPCSAHKGEPGACPVDRDVPPPGPRSSPPWPGLAPAGPTVTRLPAGKSVRENGNSDRR